MREEGGVIDPFKVKAPSAIRNPGSSWTETSGARDPHLPYHRFSAESRENKFFTLLFFSSLFFYATGWLTSQVGSAKKPASPCRIRFKIVVYFE
ncbi:hypothetical protein CDAR_535301 [Caerostris darwini]|uniref:Uncharacterized protein n=1 Tax=Caerostris darwini TaxID=1538125 RepID=A0AAV4QJZ5_9ARAC|nr:hypothetical protein CDAR_535301 [Caerostris darwini]